MGVRGRPRCGRDKECQPLDIIRPDMVNGTPLANQLGLIAPFNPDRVRRKALVPKSDANRSDIRPGT